MIAQFDVEELPDTADIELEVSAERYPARIIALWRAVLFRAITDWVLYRNNEGDEKAEIWEDADEWLFHSPASGRLNSFHEVCDLLNCDPEAIREGILRCGAEEITRLRSRRR